MGEGAKKQRGELSTALLGIRLLKRSHPRRWGYSLALVSLGDNACGLATC